jgi:predicted RNase H-like nuclease (RuvC/YqgF family)
MYSDLEQRIRELEDAVRSLQEENQQLRSAARAFGDLAERLNLSLDAERRQAEDRRRYRRGSDDRRRAEADVERS